MYNILAQRKNAGLVVVLAFVGCLRSEDIVQLLITAPSFVKSYLKADNVL